MNKIKTITACVLATITMLTASITASAESWNINYTQGAPSSVSNQLVTREYIGLSSTSYVRIGCKVTTGEIKLSSTGFNPHIGSLFFQPSSNTLYENLENPNPSGCTLTLEANKSRVVASGTINIY